MTQEVRTPLVYFTRKEQDEKHTRLSYYAGDVLLLEMDILKDYVPSTGPLDEMTLVQLLVTPHEHMTLLGDLLAHARAKKTSGQEWDTLLKRTEALLTPPSR